MNNSILINGGEREWELKYLIEKEDFDSVPEKGVVQVNHYFFSSQEDFTCRIRERLDCYELTYKANTAREGDRIEYNLTISKEEAYCLMNNGISRNCFYSHFGILAPSDLYYVGYLETERKTYYSDLLKIEVDKNTYLDMIDYEVECEISSEEERIKGEEYLINRFHTSKSESKTKRFRKRLLSIRQ